MSTPTDRQIQYIQLERNDDVPLVRDRMSFLRGKRALIIWPERGTALTRKLDLVMIQREARRRAVQIAFVTHDSEVIKNADELGISTFETIQAAERGRWKRGWGKVAAKRYQKPSDEPEPEQLKPVASRVTNRRQRSRLRFFLERAIVLAVLLAVLGGAAYIVIPSADVTIYLDTQDIDISVSVTANTSTLEVDVENRVIPATLLPATAQTTVSIPTTGTEDLGASRAIGVVTFTNNTNSTIDIPEGTIVRATNTSAPVDFATTNDATLPGGSGQTVDVSITATQDSAGPVGNVPAGVINTIVGPLDGQVTVRNIRATINGDSQSLRTVTAADRDALLAQARAQLQNNAYSEMRRTLAPNQEIIISTIRIAPDGERSDWTKFSHNVGDVTDTLTLQMQAVVQAVAVDTLLARQIVFAALSAEKERGLVFDTDTIVYNEPGDYSVNAEGQIVFEMGGHAIAIGQFGQGQLQQQIANLPINDAIAIISSYPGVNSTREPLIAVAPEWYKDRMPIVPIRINIHAEAPQ
ncbi:MAG: baseplate J/gp47 family protein [Anaerolineaceae bacterium]|nr:baseplate J/gp47 family protein [Anaerolineaceae bacterium]